MDRSVNIRLHQGGTGRVKTGRGVRERCSSSPILFNLHLMQWTEGRLIRLVTSCVATSFKTNYWRKERKSDRSGGTARKKRKQLLYDVKETRWSWKLKDKSLDYTIWRTHLWLGYGSAVREVTVWKSKWFWTMFLRFIFNWRWKKSLK